MHAHTPQNGPARYRIVLSGAFGKTALTYFDEADVTTGFEWTALEITVADQAALYGFLRRVHDLHLKLISVERLDITHQTPREMS
jgi:hypothetical protein